MVCSKCGQECADDMLFCTNCGEKITKDVQEEPVENVAETAEVVQEEVTEPVKEEKKKEEKKKEKKAEKGEAGEGKSKKGFIALALVAILLLIFIPAVLNSGDDSYTKYSDKAIEDVIEYDGDAYACYLNGDNVKLDEEPNWDSMKESMDRSVTAFVNDDKELVILTKGKEIKTGIDEVEGLVVSAYGDTVAYFSDCEMAEFKVPYYYDEWLDETYYNTYKVKVGTLNLYDVKKKKSTEIAEEVCVDSAVLSPDGKTVAYVADYERNEDDEEEFKGFYSVNGKKSEELGKEKRIFAISDGAKYIYYTDADRLYVCVKDKEEKLANELSYASVMLNRDYTEMLYVCDGKTYITIKGKEKQKVTGAELTSVILKSDAAKGSYTVNTGTGRVSVTNTGVDTFKEKLFYSSSEYQIHYMLKKYETEKLVSDVTRYVVADDRESLVYLDGSKVMKVTKFTKGGEKEKLEKISNAQSIYANGDLSKIYVLDAKGDLHYVKKDKDVDVAEDVTSAVFSPDGKYFYYVEDNETLFYTKNGKKSKEIFSVDDGTLRVQRHCGVIFAANEDDGETIWYGIKGKKEKELYVED